MPNPGSGEQNKKRPKIFEWEINRIFQDQWVARFP
jgi:hypothetical protein